MLLGVYVWERPKHEKPFLSCARNFNSKIYLEEVKHFIWYSTKDELTFSKLSSRYHSSNLNLKQNKRKKQTKQTKKKNPTINQVKVTSFTNWHRNTMNVPCIRKQNRGQYTFWHHGQKSLSSGNFTEFGSLLIDVNCYWLGHWEAKKA